MGHIVKPGDLVKIDDHEDFDPRIRGKWGVIIGEVEKFNGMLTVLVDGRIFGFLSTHLHYLEVTNSGSVGSNEP